MEKEANSSKTNDTNNNMSSKDKPSRPTTLQGINGKMSLTPKDNKFINNFDTNSSRRQSLPIPSFPSNLQVPQSPLVTGLMMNTPQGGEVSSCPGSPRGRYAAAPMTPLMTPALSVSSLVSSLDGSLENLNLDDDDVEDCGSEERDYGKNGNEEDEMHHGRSGGLNNKLYLNFETAHRKDIVNNRLKYFFNTLDTEEYLEKHQGKNLAPTNNIFTNSPMVEAPLRSFKEIRDALTPTNKT